MSTPYGSPGADPAGSEPTQPFWVAPDPHAAGPTWGEQAGAAGSGPAASQAVSFGEHLRRDRHKALRWTLGIVAAALLTVGGTVAGLSATGQSAAGSGPGQASPPAARQAALLNSALDNAGSPGSLSAALNATEMSTTTTPGGAHTGAAARGSSAPVCARAGKVARAAGR